MMNTVRFYGKEVRSWTHRYEYRGEEYEKEYQIEVEYQDLRLDETLAGTGTEDFSIDRYRSQRVCCWIYTWDGKRRNKGGHRWFDCRGSVDFRKSDRKAALQYFRNKYSDCEEVQLRTT